MAGAALLALGVVGSLVAGRPLPLAVLSAPLSALDFLDSGGPFSLVWVALAAARIALVGRTLPPLLERMRPALTRLLAGSAPHVLGLMVANTWVLGRNTTPRHGPSLEAWAVWYEERVLWLSEKLDGLLLPSLEAGAVIAIATYLVSTWLQLPEVRGAVMRALGAVRPFGIAIFAACSFTALGTVGLPRPWDAAMARLELVLRQEAIQRTRLLLYTAAIGEMRSPDGELRHTFIEAVLLLAAAEREERQHPLAAPLPFRGTLADAAMISGKIRDGDRRHDVWVEEAMRETREPPRPQSASERPPRRPDSFGGMPWGQAIREAEEASASAERRARVAATEADRAKVEFRETASGVAGSVAGEVTEMALSGSVGPFVAKVISVIIEDAATRVAEPQTERPGPARERLDRAAEAVQELGDRAGLASIAVGALATIRATLARHGQLLAVRGRFMSVVRTMAEATRLVQPARANRPPGGAVRPR